MRQDIFKIGVGDKHIRRVLRELLQFDLRRATKKYGPMAASRVRVLECLVIAVVIVVAPLFVILVSD